MENTVPYIQPNQNQAMSKTDGADETMAGVGKDDYVLPTHSNIQHEEHFHITKCKVLYPDEFENTLNEHKKTTKYM